MGVGWRDLGPGHSADCNWRQMCRTLFICSFLLAPTSVLSLSSPLWAPTSRSPRRHSPVPRQLASTWALPVGGGQDGRAEETVAMGFPPLPTPALVLLSWRGASLDDSPPHVSLVLPGREASVLSQQLHWHGLTPCGQCSGTHRICPCSPAQPCHLASGGSRRGLQDVGTDPGGTGSTPLEQPHIIKKEEFPLTALSSLTAFWLKQRI